MTERHIGIMAIAIQFCASAAVCICAMLLGWPLVVGIALFFMLLSGLSLEMKPPK